MQTGTAIIKSSMEFTPQIKNGTALWPSGSTSGNTLEETQNTNSKEYMHPYVHYSIIYNRQDLEAAQVPIGRRVDKKSWGTFTQCNATQKRSEISQSEKDKYHMISLTCGT